jgi:hypothetical protein
MSGVFNLINVKNLMFYQRFFNKNKMGCGVSVPSKVPPTPKYRLKKPKHVRVVIPEYVHVQRNPRRFLKK